MTHAMRRALLTGTFDPLVRRRFWDLVLATGRTPGTTPSWPLTPWIWVRGPTGDPGKSYQSVAPAVFSFLTPIPVFSEVIPGWNMLHYTERQAYLNRAEGRVADGIAYYRTAEGAYLELLDAWVSAGQPEAL